MKIFNPLLLSLLVIVCSCGEHEAKRLQAYYENGQPNYEVPLKDGKKNGEMKGYYRTGQLRSISNWENGVLNGPMIKYYESGGTMQIHNMLEGVRTDSSLFFRSDSSLQEVQYFDNLGRIRNFKKYKRTGEQDTTWQTKKVLVLPNASDTIKLGETYQAKLILGNQSGRKIKGVLGDFDADTLLYARQPRIPVLGDTALELERKPKERGIHIIKGLVIEVFYNPETLMLHPFEHTIYVE